MLDITNKYDEYLISMGFFPTEVKSSKRYFVNKKGSQIRVGNYGITFLNKYGYVVDSFSDLEVKQVESFSKV